jgi:hypothetical protein
MSQRSLSSAKHKRVGSIGVSNANKTPTQTQTQTQTQTPKIKKINNNNFTSFVNKKQPQQPIPPTRFTIQEYLKILNDKVTVIENKLVSYNKNDDISNIETSNMTLIEEQVVNKILNDIINIEDGIKLLEDTKIKNNDNDYYEKITAYQLQQTVLDKKVEDNQIQQLSMHNMILEQQIIINKLEKTLNSLIEQGFIKTMNYINNKADMEDNMYNVEDKVEDVEEDVEEDKVEDVEEDVEEDKVEDVEEDKVEDVEEDVEEDKVEDVEEDVEEDKVEDVEEDVEEDKVEDVEEDVEEDKVEDVEEDVGK